MRSVEKNLRRRNWAGRTPALLALFFSLCCAGLSRASADTSLDNAAVEFFENRIRPILVQNCWSCHSVAAGKDNGGLRLDSREAILTGGDSGSAVSLTDIDQSLILRAIERNDTEVSPMPPTSALSPKEVADIRKWISQGAVFPEYETDSTVHASDHWAFRPVASKPVAPELSEDPWARSDIDRLIRCAQKEMDLTPAPDADWPTIARRLSQSLVGLPLSVDQWNSVRHDVQQHGAPNALETLIDRLLASDQFGVRWARHWLDLVRYSESAGHEYDYEIEGAWRYRDYVVRAFNSDLPYDQFVREQIAGDLIEPRVVEGRNESLLATGWWLLQECPTAPVDILKDEADRLDNQIDVLGKAFQGLTIGCARCHDHKFDPISTKEYYGIFGILAASPGVRSWANQPAIDECYHALAERYAAWDRQHSHRIDAGDSAYTACQDYRVQLNERSTWIGDFSQQVPVDWSVIGHVQSVSPQEAQRFEKQPGLWSGLLSRRLPALIRSPRFKIERDSIDVLVSGKDSTVQVILSNYQMIRAPIYNVLRHKIDSETYRWVRIPVGRWKGLMAQVEIFSGTVDSAHRILHTHTMKESQFGVLAAIQCDGEPPSIPDPLDQSDWGRSAWYTSIEDYEKTIPAPERFLALCDTQGADVPIYRRGEPHLATEEMVPRQFLSVVGTNHEAFSRGSGRLALAEVICSSQNPLTARLIVNRIWHHLFGKGLVPTVDNFGLMGERPSHPELLDMLADRLVNVHHWRLKPLIREIVTSRVFWQQSMLPPANDPTNRWLSCFPIQRLSAESIRDSIMLFSGSLSLELEGESIPVPHRLAGSGSDSGNNDAENGPVDGLGRRSLYLAGRRNYPSVFLTVFDKPTSLSTFGRRDVTTVATQALTLLNDPMVIEQCDRLASRIVDDGKTDEQRIHDLVVVAFGREPNPCERAELLEQIAMQRRDQVSEHEIWSDLAMAFINAKEFIYVR